MKRLLGLVLAFMMLSGCKNQNEELNQVLQMREKLQQSNGCSFSADITADYGDKIYVFGMDCLSDNQGSLSFTVKNPETIVGITGHIDASNGKITYDDKVLLFEKIVDGQIAPITVPWLIVKTLHSGYITAAGKDENYIHATINDTYDEQALELEFWFNEDCCPERCEVLWQGRRVLSAKVENFVIL